MAGNGSKSSSSIDRNLCSSAHYVWRLSDNVGHGSFGKVFKGLHKVTGERVAVKAFNSKTSQMALRQQYQELSVLQRIDHPNVVRFIAVEDELRFVSGSSDPLAGGSVLVMELCTLGSLAMEIDDPQNYFGLPEPGLMLVLRHITEGIRYLRSINLIHRDLKPQNILKSADSAIGVLYKIADFGASRNCEENQQFNSIVGTEEYLCPDIYKFVKYGGLDSQFSANSDLWSLGVTLYQVATGKLPFTPFQGRQDKETMCKMITEKGPDVISAYQKSQNGRINWCNDLPPTCQLSNGMRPEIVALLRLVLQSDKNKRPSFSEYFDLTDGLFYEYDRRRAERGDVETRNQSLSMPEVNNCAASGCIRDIKAANNHASGFNSLMQSVGSTNLFVGAGFEAGFDQLESPGSKDNGQVSTPSNSLMSLANEFRVEEAERKVSVDLERARLISALICQMRRDVDAKERLSARVLATLKEKLQTEKTRLASIMESFADGALVWKGLEAQTTSLCLSHGLLAAKFDGIPKNAEEFVAKKEKSAREISIFTRQLEHNVTRAKATVDSFETELAAVCADSGDTGDTHQSDHPMSEFLSESHHTVLDIFSQFRKNKTIRIYENPGHNVHNLKWHDLLREQMLLLWKDCYAKYSNLRFPVLDAVVIRSKDLCRLMTEIESGHNNLQERLTSHKDMVRAYWSAFEQTVEDYNNVIQNLDMIHSFQGITPSLNFESIASSIQHSDQNASGLTPLRTPLVDGNHQNHTPKSSTNDSISTTMTSQNGTTEDEQIRSFEQSFNGTGTSVGGGGDGTPRSESRKKAKKPRKAIPNENVMKELQSLNKRNVENRSLLKMNEDLVEMLGSMISDKL